MSLRAVFGVREHEEYGSLGLSMEGRWWADPLGGPAALQVRVKEQKADRIMISRSFPRAAA